MHTTTDFTGHHIYVGLDISKTSWKVCILTELVEHKTFTQLLSVEVLVRYLKRNFPNAYYSRTFLLLCNKAVAANRNH